LNSSEKRILIEGIPSVIYAIPEFRDGMYFAFFSLLKRNTKTGEDEFFWFVVRVSGWSEDITRY